MLVSKENEERVDKIIEEGGYEREGEGKGKSIEDSSKFEFVLKPWANNYIVTTFEDYQRLPKMVVDGKEVVDYEQCLRDGIDAVEMCAIGDEYDELSTQEDFDKTR